MKRVLLAAFVLCLALPAAVDGQPKKKKLTPPCVATFDDCKNTGCGTKFDPELNKRKNITKNDNAVTGRTVQWIKKLDDPEHFSEGDTREELTALGEGDMISIVAYVLVVRSELDGESCNCYFHTPETTDNHLVVVTKTTVDKFPLTNTAATNKARFAARERESITAEFTPRDRVDHPNFTLAFVQPLVEKASQKALLARITGQLLFDSEHFIRFPLKRATNWEIHPIFQFEVCQTGSNCKATSDAGWKSVDDM